MFRKKKFKAKLAQWHLRQQLMSLNNTEWLTIGDVCQGVQIFGATGSGKTTASFAALLLAMMMLGFGGTLFTSKPSDRDYFLMLCRLANRLSDVIIISPDNQYRFNALEAELHRKDAGAGHAESVVGLLKAMLEITQGKGQSSGEDGKYWELATLQLFRNAVTILICAQGEISSYDIYRLIVSAPTTTEQFHSEDWRRKSHFCITVATANRNKLDPLIQRDLQLAAGYFVEEWLFLSDRTRSVILSVASSMLDMLNRGIIREFTCSKSNVFPEMMGDGKIFIYDFPIKVFGEIGRLLQVQWKYCAQRALERRFVDDETRPVFLASDESHFLFVESDVLFQTTARSSKVATVNVTQSISNYLTVLGEHAEPQVHSLLGNMQNQVFHQQTDTKTNLYAAELIGRNRQYVFNSSSSNDSNGWLARMAGLGESAVTTGMSEIFEFELQPREFSTLRKGGAPQWLVDAIWVQGGRQFFQTGRPWLPVTFKQHIG